jgi:hypothetical protein
MPRKKQEPRKQKTPRKKPAEYNLEVFRNGTVKASLKVYEKASGELRYEDKEDLATATGRTKAIKRMATKLKLRNVRHYEELLEQKWHEARNEEEKQQKAEEGEGKSEPAATQEADLAYPYLVQHGRFYRRRYGRDGEEFFEPLCNFSAKIVEETTHDDGAEVKHHFVVTGQLDTGKPLPNATVSAGDFSSMNWIVQEWGSQAIANAGQGAKDHIRAAIQKFSLNGVNRRTVYGHTGWRHIDGQWVYLHAGGAIGSNGPIPGIETSLPDTLQCAILPPPPTGDELVKAVRASLSIIDLAAERITAPVQGAVYRAPLGNLDFSLFVVGSTGQFKTELVALAQQHYGGEFNSRNLPGSWVSTANATESLSFAAKDMAFVVDDFAPGGSQSDLARMHREADRIFRGVGNRSGRQRLRSDGTVRPVRPPRSLLISTGEDIPRGHSVRGRMGIVEITKGNITSENLTRCQKDAARGLYTLAMSAYASWLASRIEAIRNGLRDEVRSLRERYYEEGQHARTPGIRADLAIGWKYVLHFALDVGAITEAEVKDYQERAGVGLKVMAQAQAAHQQAAEPVSQFLALIRSALNAGRAHVASPSGGYPAENPDAWGWRKEDSNEGPIWKPQGRRVGWVDGEDLYLDPESSHAEAQGLAGAQGESIPIGSKTLSKRLEEKQKLKTTERSRGKLTVRRLLEHKRIDVWHLPALEVLCVETIGPIGPGEGEVLDL